MTSTGYRRSVGPVMSLIRQWWAYGRLGPIQVQLDCEFGEDSLFMGIA